jgi:hypothetical protein
MNDGMDERGDTVVGEAADPSEAESPPCEPGLSSLVTGLAAVILVLCLSLFGYLQATVRPLERVPAPEEALALMVGRSLELDRAMAATSPPEQVLYAVFLGAGAGELEQSIRWYEELAKESENPLVHLHLAVLEGEAGRTEALHGRLRTWEGFGAPWPLVGRLVRAAYFQGRLDRADEQELQAGLAELAPAGWFYDRLAIRLAERAGDRALLEATEAAAKRRVEPLLRRLRLLAALQGAVVVLGILSFLAIVFQDRGRRLLPIGTAPIPPPWRGRVGAAVLTRGGAVGAVLVLLFLFVSDDNLLLRLAATPVTSLPLLWLADRHLFKPAGLRFREGLGLRAMPGTLGRLGLATLALAGLAFLGEGVLDVVADAFDYASHWTEWFDADLAWGTAPLLATALIEYVVFAPLFEELVFRGLLFGTLRRRLGFAPAALVSAAIFALAHGYGALGFASVFWSGLLWAWAFEKTGSLLPGIAAHALNNLLVCLGVLGLLRP